ncbi:unnamed protein product [Acanthoscelides obtectus]|uniref:Uncharacterized protein n=1 Tax=Acanthoscelides obtectus TaxID=200917 RepID=A0A9P0K9H4_ACAOB|nr:unnamed protein product [Acanthoscelides obtectus]CAK1633490.1 hypothetical protein AOBTE_LOCUS8169 [Acanthoscelides obtectus]
MEALKQMLIGNHPCSLKLKYTIYQLSQNNIINQDKTLKSVLKRVPEISFEQYNKILIATIYWNLT